MSLSDNVSGTRLPPHQPDQWMSSHSPVIKLVQEDDTVRWLVAHNISEVIEEKGKLTIAMVSGSSYNFVYLDGIKAVRKLLVEAGVIQ